MRDHLFLSIHFSFLVLSILPNATCHSVVLVIPGYTSSIAL